MGVDFSADAVAFCRRRGLEDAARMQGGASMASRVAEDQVAVASTGVIGVPLDVDKVITGYSGAGSCGIPSCTS